MSECKNCDITTDGVILVDDVKKPVCKDCGREIVKEE